MNSTYGLMFLCLMMLLGFMVGQSGCLKRMSRSVFWGIIVFSLCSTVGIFVWVHHIRTSTPPFCADLCWGTPPR